MWLWGAWTWLWPWSKGGEVFQPKLSVASIPPSPPNPRMGQPSLPWCEHFNEARGEEIRSLWGLAGLVAQL